MNLNIKGIYDHLPTNTFPALGLGVGLVATGVYVYKLVSDNRKLQETIAEKVALEAFQKQDFEYQAQIDQQLEIDKEKLIDLQKTQQDLERQKAQLEILQKAQEESDRQKALEFKPIKELEETDSKTKALFNSLLITEWYLPKERNEQKSSSNTYLPQPKFSVKTNAEITTIKTMINKALECGSSLPNLILKGYPGVGKTMLGEHLCRQTGIGFIRIPSGAMEKMINLGNQIVALHEVLKVAAACPVPVYLIIDDGEELIAQRPSNSAKANGENTTKAPWIVEQEKLSETIGQRRIALVNAILEESGKEIRNFAFCITTNRPHVIDKAFGTRARMISIERPLMEERKQIIITHLPKIFNNDQNMLSFFNKGRLEDMAFKTEGFTGRNIVKMLEEVFACVQIEDQNITQELIDSCILSIKKSVEVEREKWHALGNAALSKLNVAGEKVKTFALFLTHHISDAVSKATTATRTKLKI